MNVEWWPKPAEDKNKSQQNHVEKASVQENRKLDIYRHALLSARQSFDNDIFQKMDQKKSNDFLARFEPWFDFFPSNKPSKKPEDTRKNFVETDERISKKANLEKHERAYSEQLTKTYESDMWELKDDSQKQKLAEKYLKGAIKDLWMKPGELSVDNLIKITETAPDVMRDFLATKGLWELEKTLFNGKNTADTIKSTLAKELAKELSTIFEGKISEDQAQKIIMSMRDSDDESERSLDIPTVKPRGIPDSPYKASKDPRYVYGVSQSGRSDTQWGAVSWVDSKPEYTIEGSQMTTDTYKWQGSGFKLRWSIPGIQKSPATLAKLAEQGTNPGGSTGYCYRAVKNHLCAAGYIDSSEKLWGWQAKNAGPELESIWFKKVSSPWIWDVIVYAGGQHGHIEIKTANGYASDYFSKTSPWNRTVIGIYRPPV